jgi:hypothetical protein
MKRVDDLFLDPGSPRGIAVFQLTEGEKPSSLIYPDVPAFLHDGRRMVYHGPDGPMVCNLDDPAATRPLCDAPAKGCHLAVYPSGRFVALGETSAEKGGQFRVWRADADTGRVDPVFECTGKVPGLSIQAGKLSVATVSSDGLRFAATAFLGDGHTKNAPFGVIVIEPGSGAITVAAESPHLLTHLQYCKSTDADASHDLLVQQNHGSIVDETGHFLRLLGPPSDGGADVHALRDDGTRWRDLPWGRDGQESCIGHQMWRGTGGSAVTITLQNQDTSYGWADGTRQEVIVGWPVPADPAKPHIGRQHKGSRRVLLSEGVPNGRWCHFGLDASGLRCVLDTFPIYNGIRAGMEVWIASAPDENRAMTFRYILNSGTTFPGKWSHAHPILSPNGNELLFNSDLSGANQIYMVTGLAYPG